MTRRASGWALVLVLFLELSRAGVVFAHALPGSLLTFSQDEEGSTLTISLPLEDLALAHSAFAALQEAPLDKALPADRIERLAEYFADHVAIEHNTMDLPLTLESAVLRSARNEHVGRYTLLVLSFPVGVSNVADAAPLTLTYDAVMHEVRNHRATVFWTSPDERPVMIADFGFHPIDGAQQSVSLRPPRDRERHRHIGRPAMRPPSRRARGTRAQSSPASSSTRRAMRKHSRAMGTPA